MQVMLAHKRHNLNQPKSNLRKVVQMDNTTTATEIAPVTHAFPTLAAAATKRTVLRRANSLYVSVLQGLTMTAHSV